MKKKRKSTLEADVKYIRKSIEKTSKIADFSIDDVIFTFFAAFALGLVFIFKGKMIEISKNLGWVHVGLIIGLSLFIMAAIVYYFAYGKHKVDIHKRAPFEFVSKRVISSYIIAVIAAILLVFIYNINSNASNFGEIVRIVVAISLPCSIGATIKDLFKKI
ncbi:DUF2391 family protein [Nanoarchaeota archaeon]